MQEEIIYRYLVGKCTGEEELAVKEWYEQDPEAHQREIDRVRFLFEGVLMHRVIGRPAARTENRKPSLRPLVQRVMRVAAVVALMAGSIYGTHEHVYREISGRTTTFEVPAGQRIGIDLADGTHVWLNAGSKIEYPVVFGRKDRQVKISGEAMFDVVPDPRRPFVVETFASKIEVLGTKFNVEAYEAENSFSTTLLRGRVKVTADGQEVYLNPDQTVDLIDGNLVVTRTEDPAMALWTEGILSLKGVPFEVLMRKFEKIYDVRFVYRCATMPVAEFSSGKIRIADGVDHALRVLQHVAKFTFEHDEESNVIYII